MIYEIQCNSYIEIFGRNIFGELKLLIVINIDKGGQIGKMYEKDYESNSYRNCVYMHFLLFEGAIKMNLRSFTNKFMQKHDWRNG